MNGIPVYPLPKNGERPYLATSAASFLGLFFGYFYPNFVSSSCRTSHPIQHFIIYTATLLLNILIQSPIAR